MGQAGQAFSLGLTKSVALYMLPGNTGDVAILRAMELTPKPA
jgi:hypothetical protein